MPRAALVAALAAAATFGSVASPAHAANPQLTARVGPGYEISLRDADGTSLAGVTIAPGTYDIVVVDTTTRQNFHLSGPGVERTTTIAGTESLTWTVTFAPGQDWHFQCDPHSDMMFGDLQTASAGPPPATHGLSVTPAGAGSGTVTSTPAAISCGVTCSASFLAGTTVTLTATALPGSAFQGWSGACGGIGACTLVMTAGRSVTATFLQLPGIPPMPDDPNPPAGVGAPPPPPSQPALPAQTLRGFRVQVRMLAAGRALVVRATLGHRTPGLVQLMRRGREAARWRRTLSAGASTSALAIPRSVKAG